MTAADESKASPDAVSSTFGLPGGVSDAVPGVVLCETHRNGPSLDANLQPLPVGGEPPEMEGRGVYRLVFVILCLTIGLLTEARRLVDAAALLMP